MFVCLCVGGCVGGCVFYEKLPRDLNLVCIEQSLLGLVKITRVLLLEPPIFIVEVNSGLVKLIVMIQVSNNQQHKIKIQWGIYQ